MQRVSGMTATVLVVFSALGVSTLQTGAVAQSGRGFGSGGTVSSGGFNAPAPRVYGQHTYYGSAPSWAAVGLENGRYEPIRSGAWQSRNDYSGVGVRVYRPGPEGYYAPGAQDPNVIRYHRPPEPQPEPTYPSATLTPTPPTIPQPPAPTLHHWHDHDGNTGWYFGAGTSTVIVLDGYFYSDYVAAPVGPCVYPSVYSVYGGPQFIYNPGIIVLSQPYPVYATGYMPIETPDDSTAPADGDSGDADASGSVDPSVTSQEGATTQTADQTAAQPQDQPSPAVPDDSSASGTAAGNTSVASAQADDESGTSLTDSGDTTAAPETYTEAFADIERAWRTGDIDLIRDHLRSPTTKISILLNRTYSYSIASDDFANITHDAFQQLSTVSFKFTRIRKADNGDITAYGVHIYRQNSDDANDDAGAKPGSTAPFDTSNPEPASSMASVDKPAEATPADGSKDLTMYVSYTLRHLDDEWYIVIVDSSKHILAPDQDAGN